MAVKLKIPASRSNAQGPRRGSRGGRVSLLGRDPIVRVALIAFLSLSLLIVGFFALIASGAKMGDIQREAQAQMRARQDELAKS